MFDVVSHFSCPPWDEYDEDDAEERGQVLLIKKTPPTVACKVQIGIKIFFLQRVTSIVRVVFDGPILIAYVVLLVQFVVDFARNIQHWRKTKTQVYCEIIKKDLAVTDS